MDLHLTVLRVENQAAEPEHVLDDPVLRFTDVLKLLQVDALVVVEGDQRLFNPMDFAIGQNDHVEEITIEPCEKFQVNADEERRKQEEQRTAHTGVIDGDEGKEQQADGNDEHTQQYAPHRRPQHANPVLAEVKHELLVRIGIRKTNIGLERRIHHTSVMQNA